MIKFSASKGYLKSLPEDYPLTVVSFFATNSSAIEKLEKQWSQRDPAHKIYLGRNEEETKKVTSVELGGSICLVDPLNLNKGFLCELECLTATGMYFSEAIQTLYVGSNKWVKLIRRGKIIGEIGNTLFNDIHSLNKTWSGNLLVASTGVDGLLEIDFGNSQRIIWDWLATENGYDTTPSGDKRIIDRTENFQKIGTNTTQHATHINSGLEYKQGFILATLFHQGTLIEINKRTKLHRVIFEGMQSPHSVRERRNGYIVSDSRNNRVVLFDKALKPDGFIHGDYNWVHDCIEVAGDLYLVADSNNSRVVLVSEGGKLQDVYNIEKGTKKISTFISVTTKAAMQIFYE